MILFCYILIAVCSLIGAIPIQDGRIVGGHDVEIEDFPYQISMAYYGSHRCGATIISENWALTAALCIEDAWPFELSFRAGSTDKHRNGSIHMANEIFVNPKFNAKTYDYDFALVSVNQPFVFGSNVQPIKLTDSEAKENMMVTLSGWGTTQWGGESPRHLQAVDIPIISREKCNIAYENRITDRMICAGVDEGGKDACHGDAGGPLVDRTTLMQVGVASWGWGCADPHVPGVYSNLANAEARQWIKEISGV